MRRRSINQWGKSPFYNLEMPPNYVSGISQSFLWVSQAERQVTYVLLTRSPLGIATSFDLHVLGTPPAFILSQDQTLKKFNI